MRHACDRLCTRVGVRSYRGGRPGFLVNNIDEAVEAIGQLQTLDRCEIRHRFEQRFSVTRMARDYVEIYQRLARPSTRRLRIA
jgi:glycosyltransferase involved in cell wall biosynthesis